MKNGQQPKLNAFPAGERIVPIAEKQKQIPARVVPLAPYLGGKFRLSKRIIDKIEQIPHKIYAEPFVGMGGIFLRRTQIPKAEIINDINGDLVNLYRIVRRYPDTLYKETEFLFASVMMLELSHSLLCVLRSYTEGKLCVEILTLPVLDTMDAAALYVSPAITAYISS